MREAERSGAPLTRRHARRSGARRHRGHALHRRPSRPVLAHRRRARARRRQHRRCQDPHAAERHGARHVPGAGPGTAAPSTGRKSSRSSRCCSRTCCRAGSSRMSSSTRRRRIASRTRVFTVPPRVLIDNTASRTHTVDRGQRPRPAGPAVRADARADAGSICRFSSAKISTYGEKVVDVFYVKDLFGHKVEHEERIKAIRERLDRGARRGGGRRAAAAPPRQGPHRRGIARRSLGAAHGPRLSPGRWIEDALRGLGVVADLFEALGDALRQHVEAPRCWPSPPAPPSRGYWRCPSRTPSWKSPPGLARRSSIDPLGLVRSLIIACSSSMLCAGEFEIAPHPRLRALERKLVGLGQCLDVAALALRHRIEIDIGDFPLAHDAAEIHERFAGIAGIVRCHITASRPRTAVGKKGLGPKPWLCVQDKSQPRRSQARRAPGHSINRVSPSSHCHAARPSRNPGDSVRIASAPSPTGAKASAGCPLTSQAKPPRIGSATAHG